MVPVVMPPDDAVPFALTEGWPFALPGNVVTMRETGIALGSLLLEDEEWRTMRSGRVFSLRIDDHPVVDGWTTRSPDGSESTVEFEVPISPVAVPSDALAHGRALNDWVMSTHGALGRLLIWDEPRRWWMVHEPDLELVLTCAPAGLFAEPTEDLSWLSFGSAQGEREVADLRLRYDLGGSPN
jgi:hypothetical protein